MTLSQTLPSGRAFEEEIFGFTDYDPLGYRAPLERGWGSSFQYIVRMNWSMYGESLVTGDAYCHNPVNPEMGRTRELWSAVRRHLPRRVQGRQSLPLNLYVAIGRTSLDCHHGVDAFFWWQGAFVTFDVSLRQKEKEGSLKARSDFVLSPEHLSPEGLNLWSKKVARLLKERSHASRYIQANRAPNVVSVCEDE